MAGGKPVGAAGVVMGAGVMAAGLGATLTGVLVTLAVVNAVPPASPTPFPTTNLLGHLNHLYKGTYIVYGHGRESERDLPECSSPREACNLAHRRFWLTPITERLCWCADRSECPLDYTHQQHPLSQHLSNRAQFKFCGPILQELPECQAGETALMVKVTAWTDVAYPGGDGTTTTQKKMGADTNTTLLCRCPWPRAWTLAHHHTTQDLTVAHYTCTPLPKCETGEVCGAIRADTLETYYSCSCPEDHLCVFRRPQTPEPTHRLHFNGPAFTARCYPI